jgi:hypothetical protein
MIFNIYIQIEHQTKQREVLYDLFFNRSLCEYFICTDNNNRYSCGNFLWTKNLQTFYAMDG